MTNDHTKILKADRVYRRKLFLSYFAVICFGIVFWNFLLPVLINKLENLPNKERIEAKELIAHLILLFFIPVAIYVITIGRRVCRYETIPYPGMKVIRDTAIVTGKKAITRGRSLIIQRFRNNPLFRAGLTENLNCLIEIKLHEPASLAEGITFDSIISGQIVMLRQV